MTEPSPAPDKNADAASTSGLTSDFLALIVLIAPAALLGAAASATSFLAQTTGGWDPASVTIFVAIVSLAEAAGSAAAIRVRRTARGAQAVLGGLGAASLALAAIVPAAFLPVAVTLAFLVGLAHPLRATAVQRLVADGVRARAASFASACDMAVHTIVLPLAGSWRQRRR